MPFHNCSGAGEDTKAVDDAVRLTLSNTISPRGAVLMMWFHLPSSRELNRRVRETMLSYAASDFFHKEALSDGVWRANCA